MSWRTLSRLSAAVLASTSLLAGAAGALAQDVIKIGHYGSLTGS